MRMVGVRIPLSTDMEENYRIIPEFWKSVLSSNLFSEICVLSNQSPKGILGVSVYESPQRIFYYAFCKTVLRNAAINAYRDMKREQKREVSLNYLMSETSFEPFTMDIYFEQYDKPTVFIVQSHEIIIVNERLAIALSRLPEQRRVVLLMYFFLGYTDTKIGNEYGRSRSTANYWKLAALKQLKKEWEKTKHEE